MPLTGTIIDGGVRLDAPTDLPDGTRVKLVPTEYAYPHPMAPYDRDKEIELLRERIAAADAGEPSLSIEEAFARVDAVLDQIEARTRRPS